MNGAQGTQEAPGEQEVPGTIITPDNVPAYPIYPPEIQPSPDVTIPGEEKPYPDITVGPSDPEIETPHDPNIIEPGDFPNFAPPEKPDFPSEVPTIMASPATENSEIPE